MNDISPNARLSQGIDCPICGGPICGGDQGEFLDQDVFDHDSWFQVIAHVQCGEENGLEKVRSKR